MNPLLRTALEAAEAASRVHLLHLGRFSVDEAREKGRSDFVSMVDLEAQEAALAVIRSRYPEHRILAEEETEEEAGMIWREGEASWAGGAHTTLEGSQHPAAREWPRDGSHLWIVDPLDGTTNYLHRHPMFAAAVAVGRLVPEEEGGTGGVLMRGEGPGTAGSGAGTAGYGTEAPGRVGVLEAGAVVAPRTGERWWACRGGGAWKNGQPIKVSGIRSLRSALVGTGFPFKEPHLLPRYAEQFQRVLPASGGVRRGGSAALDLCYLAEGIFDAFWEEEYLAPWDVAAGLLLVQEAGGVATRLDGRAFDLKDGSVLAANSPELLRELGEVVRGEIG
jgi:myo-inositol-1(or 4)-monophosphatase